MNYEKDQESMLELIVQLERFTSLHDDPLRREYFYNSININSVPIHQIFNRIAEEISRTKALSFVKCPIIIKSQAPYKACSRFAKTNGRANNTRVFGILPSVKFCSLLNILTMLI